MLLRVVSSLHVSYDEEMDAYACVLEKLRDEDYRRLADYRVDVRSSFSTWLAVVARRIGLDHLRQRYGRTELNDQETLERRATRRRLVDLVSSEPDMTELPERGRATPESALEERELLASLDEAMAQLTPNEQLLVGLRFHDGLSAAEIASIVSLPTAFHVYRRLNLILKKLRRFLVRRGVERSDG
jgi:RNA polymerase sigma factor (sigma-70 family)